MENLNAENIINEIQSLIKALKDCGGWVKRGNGEGWFNHEILADTLALIKELSEEKETLASRLMTIHDKAVKKERELTKENERLHASYTELTRKCASLNEEKLSIRLDAMEKLRERVKAQKFTHKNLGELIYVDDIDQISKEILEGV